MQRRWNASSKGVDNAHRVAVMKFPIDIKQLSLTPKDAEFVAMMNLSLEDIARAYAVPIDKVGGKRTYQNVDDSERCSGMIALSRKPSSSPPRSRATVTAVRRRPVAEFDTSDVAVLHEAETAKWERWKGQIESGAKVINEYRSEKASIRCRG